MNKVLFNLNKAIAALVVCFVITAGIFARGGKDDTVPTELQAEIVVDAENPYSWAAAAAQDPDRAVPPSAENAGREYRPSRGQDERDFSSRGMPPQPQKTFPDGRTNRDFQKEDVPPVAPGTGGMRGQRGQRSEMDGRMKPNDSPTVNVSSRDIISSSADKVEDMDFAVVATVNLDTLNMTVDSSGGRYDSAVGLSETDNGIVLTSTAPVPVRFVLSGYLDGTVTIESSSSDCAVVLDNVVVAAIDGPALYFDTDARAFLVIASGSENILSDSATRSDGNGQKGALVAKSALVISAEDGEFAPTAESGTLVVNGKFRNGIFSEDYIRFRSGMVAVNSDARDGIRCVNGFIMDAGDLTITGTGSVEDEESKGIKIDGMESDVYAGEGFVLVQDGRLTITTVGKAITAAWNAKDDAKTSVTSDDPNANVTINGGVIDIVTTAVPYERYQSDGKLVSCSPEGIEAKNILSVNAGIVRVRTGDDALNAGKSVVVNGGMVYAESTLNDAIDSNGTLVINAGTVTAIGANGAESAFDCDNNLFSINGGTVVGQGGSNITMPVSGSEQNILVVFKQMKEGQVVTLQDILENTILSYTVPRSLDTLIVSTSAIENYTEYTVNVDSESIGSFETVEAGKSAVSTVGNLTSRFGGRSGSGRAEDGADMERSSGRNNAGK